MRAEDVTGNAESSEERRKSPGIKPQGNRTYTRRPEASTRNRKSVKE